MVLNVFKYYYKILSRTPIVQVRTPSKVFAKYFLGNETYPLRGGTYPGLPSDKNQIKG